MTGQVESEPNKLDASNVTALGYQAAGRGVNDLKGRPGILVSSQGHALKQVQDQPQGPREVQFYQKISSSDDPECRQWRELAPTFFGIESMEGADGKSSQYLVLGNYLIIFSASFVSDEMYIHMYFRKLDLWADQALCDGHQARGEDLAARSHSGEDSPGLGQVHGHQDTFWVWCSRNGATHRPGFEKDR